MRCDDGGRNLEIISRGFRNPWDITADSGFNWLGTDNDQTTGDRVFMPFLGAHFGWNHPWSSHWSDELHPPTAPVSGPMFEGSGTGVIFYDAPQFPANYRNAFVINDWLRKTTFIWRPKWDGALLRPAEGTWEPFAEGAAVLYRPTDVEVGPDGALWVLGWGTGYGAEWDNGKLTNEGRVFRIAWKDAAAPHWDKPNRAKPRTEWTVAELIEDFLGPLPAWRTDAQEELVRRGGAVKPLLLSALHGGRLSESQETWTAWTFGRLLPEDPEIAVSFARVLAKDSSASLNLRIQALRILAHRIREFGREKALPAEAVAMLASQEPRLRMAAVLAVSAARQRNLVPNLCELLAAESDPTTFYSAWQALRELSSLDELRSLLTDSRGGVRRAALLALLESDSLKPDQVRALSMDSDPGTRDIAQMRLPKTAVSATASRELRAVPKPLADSAVDVSLIRNLKVRSNGAYRAAAGGLAPGALVYTDRSYRLKEVAPQLLGADLIQTANDDDGSQGDSWLSFESLLPARIWIAVDARLPKPPRWLRDGYQRSDEKIVTDDCTLQLYSREVAAGAVVLGGNTDNGKAGGKSNYLIALEPLPLVQQPQPVTIDQVLAAVDKGDAARGEVLFKHQGGAGCIKCHSLNEKKNGFGPNLSGIGQRAATKHLVQSMLEPDAVIVEGFNLQTVETDDGKIHFGVLLEESGLSLTLGLAAGERKTISKSEIERRMASRHSAMPSVALLLTPQHVADLTVFLAAQKALLAAAPQPAPAGAAKRGFAVEEKSDRLIISHSDKPVAEFVFGDKKILRPYFANVHAPGGLQVTRSHPPVADRDALDHAENHPGLWLGFGDISGSDFWRNQGRIEHVRFSAKPVVKDDHLSFATESKLLTRDDKLLCLLNNRFTLSSRPEGWLLVWDATFRSEDGDFTFGDQEEMGFGARVATPLTEKGGGVIINSVGRKTAAATWGQAAKWCDYSGAAGDHKAGITLMAAPSNFRESWWHNRDYGVFVANPFGRAAMRQGERSSVTIKRGESFRIVFGAVFHDAADYDPAATYTDFVKTIDPDR